jgi:hypothetical protein
MVSEGSSLNARDFCPHTQIPNQADILGPVQILGCRNPTAQAKDYYFRNKDGRLVPSGRRRGNALKGTKLWLRLRLRLDAQVRVQVQGLASSNVHFLIKLCASWCSHLYVVAARPEMHGF